VSVRHKNRMQLPVKTNPLKTKKQKTPCWSKGIWHQSLPGNYSTRKETVWTVIWNKSH